MEKYEQYEVVKQFWGWIMVFGLSAALITWAMVMHMSVSEVERAWDFGQLPDTPGKYVYSVQVPPVDQAPPRQIQPLPESRYFQSSRYFRQQSKSGSSQTPTSAPVSQGEP